MRLWLGIFLMVFVAIAPVTAQQASLVERVAGKWQAKDPMCSPELNLAAMDRDHIVVDGQPYPMNVTSDHAFTAGNLFETMDRGVYTTPMAFDLVSDGELQLTIRGPDVVAHCHYQRAGN